MVETRSRRSGSNGAGRLCLDFVMHGGSMLEASMLGASMLGAVGDEVADGEQDTAALAGWLAEVGLPTPVGGLMADDLAAAADLRTAIERGGRAMVAGGEIAERDVRRINSVASHPTPVDLLESGGRRKIAGSLVDLSASLAVIARDAVHLFAEPGQRVRVCARPSCGTLFYDRSPAGRRRWCSMKGCGEIVASAAYRRRRNEASTVVSSVSSVSDE
jgi:predicted RNA-binding Zn ribbon-like protein